jgi:hypothetical protein
VFGATALLIMGARMSTHRRLRRISNDNIMSPEFLNRFDIICVMERLLKGKSGYL